MSFDPKAEGKTDLDKLEVGDHIWVKAEVTGIDGDGEISLSVPSIVTHSDEDNPHSPLVVDDVSYFTMYRSAIKYANGEQTPPQPGDIVYSQNSPGTFGKLLTVYKGQGIIDWGYESPPNVPAALSTLSMGVLRRQGE